MVGLSQGGTLLLNYLRKHGDLCPVQAACTICSAWDGWSGMRNMYEKQPALLSYFLKSAKKLYIERNKESLCNANMEAFLACRNSETGKHFYTASFPFTEYDTYEGNKYTMAGTLHTCDGGMKAALIMIP